ncbi:MAG: biopolymer transporter ExbD [Geovibrio sp.]|uniref:Biopolymer transporter ExbD n=1 Tax=Geovibrio thiophilus TaxID=139438 RepID=A0A410K043_9BACT|nr:MULTISPECIES: biopolymer transporter ExbD [Geovibrio]MCD8491376.1 biopolymer transporter ExbD [Geovibrio sp.]QAR33782.1 biopolymer transporter ExbD [Geovibrio thiophilus]
MQRIARRSSGNSSSIDMTPMIDLIFLLLIFFIVTTSFVKETGIEVEKPVAATAQKKEDSSVLIAVTGDGRIFMDNQEVDIRSVRGRVSVMLSDNPKAAAVVIADKNARVETVVEIMDQCRLAGVNHVSLAAKGGQ